ncbi:uncharacterized protein BJ171DRAFT_523049 [Polychytrium aggregatum]|uniref:uncharacterized protein n=1 Tax=Polychytrium aggregatum TaxID=110093 RepID=UPI0022FE1E7C|nr:uncharacterized protein BJ171DRAFT_523049 [Polychytrium aggregatum]KAI9197078.1 hypothetical protein BJ171DRAFT_523049 [Polychytrium aggregatum]
MALIASSHDEPMNDNASSALPASAAVASAVDSKPSPRASIVITPAAPANPGAPSLIPTLLRLSGNSSAPLEVDTSNQYLKGTDGLEKSFTAMLGVIPATSSQSLSDPADAPASPNVARLMELPVTSTAQLKVQERKDPLENRRETFGTTRTQSFATPSPVKSPLRPTGSLNFPNITTTASQSSSVIVDTSSNSVLHAISPMSPTSPLANNFNSSSHGIASSVGSTPMLKQGTVTRRLTISSSFFDPERRLRRNKSEKDVLVGTPVKEGHVNYMLMYDMLTGIRISVSRCNAKPARPLSPADYKAANKLAFDVTGNELTPSSKYDFKFKDYAPWVFRYIRDAFKVDPAEYLLSLTGKYVLSELGSPGKSGSFFYFSQDYRFIIKTIHHGEHKFLRKILQQYYEHICHNPHTLVSRIFGLHRVKLPGNRKIHFVVMGNVFPANKDIHEVYDLKGSTIGRELKVDEPKPGDVMKDLNFLNRKKRIVLGPEKRQTLIDQLEKDVAFLIRMRIMDYSLLIGYHDTIKGNKDNIRENTLNVFEPQKETLSRPTLQKRGSRSSAFKRSIIESEAVTLGSAKLPDNTPSERKYCNFYRDHGGYYSTDDQNNPGLEIYYIGIIDIFTKYNAAKRVEHAWKSMSADGTQISAVNPVLYGARFLNFIKAAIKEVKSAELLASIPESISLSPSGPLLAGPLDGLESSDSIRTGSMTSEHIQVYRQQQQSSSYTTTNMSADSHPTRGALQNQPSNASVVSGSSAMKNQVSMTSMSTGGHSN